MYKFSLSFLFLCALLVMGADYHYTLVGKYSPKHTIKADLALTDGKTVYNGPHIIWDSGVAPNGCGFIINFDNPTAISRIVVSTAKPNHIPYIPERTEFSVWDDAKDVWGTPAVIKDVTGRCKDAKFVTGDPIKTEWKGSVTTSAVKVLMYSTAIWLTEVEVYDADGNLLKGAGVDDAPQGVKVFKPAAAACCPSVNLSHYTPNGMYVGFPNVLPRKDRVIFSYNVSEFLNAGKVSKAVLRLNCGKMGKLQAHRIAVHAFANEHWPLQSIDIIAADVKQVGTFVFDAASYNVITLDVTELLNEQLANGIGHVGFRVSSLTAERFGNRQSGVDGIVVQHKLSTLEIVE